MKSKKHTGTYYTPEYLSEFIVKYLAENFNSETYLSFFEPSVGDGSFAKAFNRADFPESLKHFSFTGIDKIKPELDKARIAARTTKRKETKYYFVRNDFLQYQKTITRKFSFIAGNPPYIKKQFLNKAQIAICETIYQSANLPYTTVKNIWPAFVIRCSQLLSKNGVMAMILPSDLLQLKFSSDLRNYLTSIFQRTEIFTFDDLLFECKGQDTILMIGYKKHTQKGQFFTHIADIKQLSSRQFTLTENTTLVTTKTKWTHHSLSSDELTFIHKIGPRLKQINHYCDSRPGIVTAANNFFIINKDTEKKYNLSGYTQSIIQKGFFVNGSVVFGRKEYSQLVSEGKPTKVLTISDTEAASLPLSVRKYLEIGAQDKLSTGYKCSQRKNWFVIPNIAEAPEGFFFRRVHQYPKLLKNDANVLVTDSAYKIEMRENYKINDLIYSFYNSLSLTFAELGGRYYGGGVLELTPSEFKAIPVPYAEISGSNFNKYVQIFESKNEIADVLGVFDFKILNASLGLNSEEIKRIQSIYQKLISKRFREKAK